MYVRFLCEGPENGAVRAPVGGSPRKFPNLSEMESKDSGGGIHMGRELEEEAGGDKDVMIKLLMTRSKFYQDE